MGIVGRFALDDGWVRISVAVAALHAEVDFGARTAVSAKQRFVWSPRLMVCTTESVTLPWGESS